MGSKRPNSPTRKRRKRSLLELDDNKDDEAWDLTTNNSNNKNTNNRKKIVAKKKYSNGNKISYLGPAKVLSQDGTWVGIIAIKNELYEFVHDEQKVLGLINMIQTDQKRRALGADINYKKVISKDGKLVMVKQEFTSHLEYASPISAKGGGGTAFTKVENIVLVDGACPIMAAQWKTLKCNPGLEPYASGNIGKLHNLWVYLIVVLNYGTIYSSMVSKRTVDSIRKKMTAYMTKKKTDADSLRVRSIFVKWGGPKDVVQTSYVYIVRKYMLPLFFQNNKYLHRH